MDIFLPEYISPNDRNNAYFFINMLLKSLPIKPDIKECEIDETRLLLSYNKTKLKREADLKIEYNSKIYSTKFLHSDLHHYNEFESNWLSAFILNHKSQLEKFITS